MSCQNHFKKFQNHAYYVTSRLGINKCSILLNVNLSTVQKMEPRKQVKKNAEHLCNPNQESFCLQSGTHFFQNKLNSNCSATIFPSRDALVHSIQTGRLYSHKVLRGNKSFNYSCSTLERRKRHVSCTVYYGLQVQDARNLL